MKRTILLLFVIIISCMHTTKASAQNPVRFDLQVISDDGSSKTMYGYYLADKKYSETAKELVFRHHGMEICYRLLQRTVRVFDVPMIEPQVAPDTLNMPKAQRKAAMEAFQQSENERMERYNQMRKEAQDSKWMAKQIEAEQQDALNRYGLRREYVTIREMQSLRDTLAPLCIGKQLFEADEAGEFDGKFAKLKKGDRVWYINKKGRSVEKD